ncbi:hypothetical protein JVT61DRAFT_10932 [Boletus reticuloceps]|uniref:G domain-containing protein n=1 Tax=Boletus reticuloceps TaxID=495285 RepID=A0A8I3A5B4_9AGAM|nr:hypothetical protein JVT61DRAFT_10932 [Boletus reticuloceps]
MPGVAVAGAIRTGKTTVTAASQDPGPDVLVAVMGATGTGKSTFINLLTNDKRIHIGHAPESETSDIQTARYVDEKTGISVTLIDTPGFDDSREGVTDTDILEKIVRFLEPEEGERRKLNGIIYMHRISDPRVGGVSRKNLRMFHSLCGDANLKNVRIVTTNWARVSKEEGDKREVALQTGAFRALLDAEAGMRRHLNTVESAQVIMSELIPLEAVTMQIQRELEAGMTLGTTSAGTVLTAEMREMQKKHEKELADLKREMEEATKANDLALRAELAEERKALEQKMVRAEEDRERLARTLDEARKDLAAEQDKLQALRQRTDEQSTALKHLQDQTEEERKRLADQIKDAEGKRKKLEQQQQEAMRENESLVKQLETDRQEMRDQANKQSAALTYAQAKMAEETERLASEIKAGEVKRQKLEGEQREAKDRNERLIDQLAKERQNQLEEARKQSEALRNTKLKMEEDAKRLAIQIRADGDKRRKLEEEQKKAKHENDLLMQRLAAEREEKIREAKANELALKKKADEAHQKQAQYEAEIAKVEAEQQKLERRADRGVFGRYVHDMGEVIEGCVDSAGVFGLPGGLVAAPFVAGWRALVGR